MKNKEAIQYLNNLQRGMFCTVNIPLFNNEKMPITVMYIGKDRQGRYNFIDTGRFIMSREFIEQKEISINKSYDEEKAMEIYSKFRRQNMKKKGVDSNNEK